MRRRLVLAIAGVAAASVVLFAVPLGVVLRESYRDDEQLRAQRDAVGATRQIDLSGGVGDAVELPPNTDRLTVYDRSGHRIAGPGPAAADAVARRALATGRLADGQASGRLLTAVPLLVHERVSGVVWASRGDGVVASRTHRAWLRLAGLAAGLVALAVLAALLLARRLTAPLERLAGSARRLGGGDFSTRAPRSGVNELDAVAAALDATAARLDDLVSRERAFSADASHQLRTPLAALRIELEALELQGEGEAVGRALAQVERLQATIGTLLAVARDAPRGATTTDVGALLTALEGEWRPRLATRARPLHVDTTDDGLQAHADGGVVREILDVVVDNACEHGAGAVRVAVRADHAWVAIEVSDEGPGVADLQTVFERRAGSGHGIGLALARSLAHAEGGRLTVAATGPHPRFTLRLRGG
jgi:signal transduction histidine kinase